MDYSLNYLIILLHRSGSRCTVNRHPNPDMCSAKWTSYYSDDFVRGQHQQEVVDLENVVKWVCH